MIIDTTSTEALLVRKDGDGGDVLIADTTNGRVGVNKTPLYPFDVQVFAGVSIDFSYFGAGFSPKLSVRGGSGHLYLAPLSEFTIFQSQVANSTLQIQNNGGYSRIRFFGSNFNYIITNTGDLIMIPAGNVAIEKPLIIDTTSTEAFLVRKNADAGDVFAVDTTNSIVIATANIYPGTDDTYYLGEIGTPYKAWKAVILADTTDGKHYKIETINGTVTATALD